MSVTLTTTIGSASANSYLSVTNADDYFAARPFSTAWEGSDDEKAIFLKEACQLMQDFWWLGSRVNDTQALAWPRCNVWQPDKCEQFDTDEIPQQVKDAQCEIALAIKLGGADGALVTGVATTGGIRSFKLGDLSVTKESVASPASAAQLPRVQRLLRDLMTAPERRR